MKNYWVFCPSSRTQDSDKTVIISVKKQEFTYKGCVNEDTETGVE